MRFLLNVHLIERHFFARNRLSEVQNPQVLEDLDESWRSNVDFMLRLAREAEFFLGERGREWSRVEGRGGYLTNKNPKNLTQKP